jgi:hypothetical protein
MRDTKMRLAVFTVTGIKDCRLDTSLNRTCPKWAEIRDWGHVRAKSFDLKGTKSNSYKRSREFCVRIMSKQKVFLLLVVRASAQFQDF